MLYGYYNDAGDYVQAYDNAGNLTHYKVIGYRLEDPDRYTETITEDFSETNSRSYLGFDAYKLSTDVLITNRDDHYRRSTLTNRYDKQGELFYVRGSKEGKFNSDRYMVENREGQVLYRREETRMQDYYYINGVALGSTGGINDANFDNNYTPASRMQQDAPGMYTVQEDDTLQEGAQNLQHIARKIWGDGTLWYLLADANGLDPDAPLIEGQILTIPTVNSNVHNNADTFKPYDPSEIIGPQEAQPIPKAGGNGCAQFVVTVVAVVVTIVVAYYAGAEAGAYTGSKIWGAIVGGAVGGAAGNAAGQFTANALDLQDGFDWNAVGKAGLQGAATSAVGYFAEWAGVAADVGKYGGIAVKSAVQVAGNYAVSRALYDTPFSWKALTANFTCPVRIASQAASGR